MRVQVKIKTEYDHYHKGDRLNLPPALAEDLIKKGVAEKMLTIGYEKKVVSAPENKGKKAAAPESKGSEGKP